MSLSRWPFAPSRSGPLSFRPAPPVHRRPPRGHSLSSHRIESLESRRLLSVAPLRPDLLASSDTGVSDVDNITRFDNATPSAALQFLVGNTTPGALVTLYVDNVAAGSATAAGPSTLVTLNTGSKVLDGVHPVVARQTAPGDTESTNSPSLSLTVDTLPPSAPAPPDLQAASDTGASDIDNITRFDNATAAARPRM